MNPIRIHVAKPGWLSTVQDLGRYGYQQYGVPVAGAMDHYAAIVANRLVGNRDNAAVLELTLKGPELEFEGDAHIAITGADLSPTIGGKRIPLWESIEVSSGSRLCFGTAQRGTRSYLAISGGIDVPLIHGSRSTHCASETGGFEGRPLRRGDVLLIASRSREVLNSKRLPDQLIPCYEKSVTIRFIPGPQHNLFPATALTTLTSTSYTVTPESNRMGYRLTGERIVRKGPGHFISDCTTMGALQVPADGRPILLMADRQTTGGYPKIGCVITADLPLAAQLAPGDTISFSSTTMAKAQAILREQCALLDAALPQRRNFHKD
ncbi:MAG: biotin-dependent carboxyltransferase family protein [Nitrospira sp.]|nr:biotin-dependent carboxyltransferase family protein [Nitrospira sp.]